MEKHHYTDDTYYREVVDILMNEKEPAKKIAEFITEETNSIKKVWYWLTLFILSAFALTLLSCNTIGYEEEIDNTLPKEYDELVKFNKTYNELQKH